MEVVKTQTIVWEVETKVEQTMVLKFVRASHFILNKVLLLRLKVSNSFTLLKLWHILASFTFPQLCDLHVKLQRNCVKGLEVLGSLVLCDFEMIGVVQGHREELLKLPFKLILLLIEFNGRSVAVSDNFDSLITVLPLFFIVFLRVLIFEV